MMRCPKHGTTYIVEEDGMEWCEACVDDVMHEPIWAPCCICHKNQVCVSEGFDTCEECMKSG